MLVRRTDAAFPTSPTGRIARGAFAGSPWGRRPLLGVEEVEGGLRAVVYEARLDALNIAAVSDQLLELADRVGAGRLQVDLGHVRYLCVTWLGKLIAVDRRVRGGGGRLTLLDANTEVYEVFEATHLNDVLDVQEVA